MKNLLLFHGLGTGKTATGIAICNVLLELLNYNVKIYLIIPKA